jgi:threonine/homoserine/homoserine lactone efflux protein
MLGIGISLMITVEGIGLSEVFNSFAARHFIFKIFSMPYLLYLRFKIATASPPTLQTA